MKKYTARLVLKDGTQRMAEVIELSDDELELRVRQLTKAMGEVDAVNFETRAGTRIIVPMHNVSHLEIMEVR